MESGPLSTPEFKEFAKEVVLFCHITTRIAGRKHDGLLSEKGGRGFPYLVVMDAKGDVLSTVQNRSVAGFRAAVETAQAYVDLATKEDRTPAEEVQLIEAELGLGKTTPADALKRLDGLTGADEAVVKKLRDTIAAKEFDAVITKRLEGIRQASSQEEADAIVAEIGAEFWEAYQAGKRPSDDMQTATTFYSLLMQYGIMKKNAGSARAGLDGIVAMHGDNPQAKPQIEKFRKQVEEVEAGSK
ncbi:MAG: hypothetical protein KDD82_30245 [Planctomycetes bacterium]|nr:hypothetical protein [Planctomycetota bacterium]